MISDKQFLFIMGAPRSGTTWLQTMIGAHPLVCTTVELTLFDKYISSWIKVWDKEATNIEQGRWHKGLPFLWTEHEFYGFLNKFLEKVYDRVVETNSKATHILDKNPSYALYVESIDRFLPNARFIHMIRDGRDVAASCLAARQNIGFGPTTVSGAAVMWEKYVQAARKADRYPDRYLEVRYEHLLATGVDTLQETFDFCRLPATRAEVVDIIDSHKFEEMKAHKMTPAPNVKAPDGAYRKGKSGSWRTDLQPMQQYIFDRLAGDLLRELGYAEENWWADSTVQKLILPTLAPITAALKRDRHTVASYLGPTLTERIKTLVQV